MREVVRRMWVIPVLAMFWTVALSTEAMAQGSGVLAGTVVEEGGASIPGALVTITEQSTSAVRTATSSADGLFRVPALLPGRYSVTVTLSGFAPLSVTDISIAPAEVKDLGRLALKLGQVAEQVTVTADTAAVQTASSSRTGTVTADQLTNIMQKGRDIWGLMSTVPGVQDTNMNRNFTTWQSMTAITINGMPNTSKVVVMDGVNVIDELGTQAMVNPNVDAVGEVQVISSGFTAENGRSSGGLIVMTTKSGTSQFKGSAWYNARRQEWNANEYFRIKQGLAPPLYHVNIPGYSIGGPVWIPKVLDKGKLFFFVSQEFTDDLRETQLVRNNLPTELERMGDFSQTYYGNANGPGQGTLQPIIDPQTGVAFPGNKIPADRINPIGQKMVNLLPLPNYIYNTANNQYNTSNNLVETLPLHGRTNNTLRIDVVPTDRIRGSFRYIRDREDNITNNAFAPGIGWANNAVPGRIATASATMVLSPSIVYEMSVGSARNSYGWIPDDGEYYEDYRQYYRSAVGVDPPRLEPFGAYRDPQGLGYDQSDEYPYLPAMNYSGGNRAGLANYTPAQNSGRILPAANRNLRWSFTNDLSWTRGRHNYKFGFSTEWASKTEPLNPDYRGNFNFGHAADNPLNTGNGYANALLGNFTQYTELTNRIDPDRRHWHTEGYAQDSWRVNPRFTLDYGVRMTHTGAFYDPRGGTAGFYEPDWSLDNAARLYYPTCTTGVAGNQTCAAGNQRAYDLANPSELLPSAYIGNLVPNTGSLTNGMIAGGYPGMRPGEYFSFTPFVAAPRLGFAWDINGDGKQALRASTGVFYAIPTRGFGGDGWEAYYQAPKPPAAYNRIVRWADFGDIEDFAGSGKAFVETPFTSLTAGGEERSFERSYNFNLTYQRDIGFSTTAEVAYVMSRAYIGGRGVDVNRPVDSVFSLGNPNNLFNGNELNTNLLRTVYPGMGGITKYIDQRDSDQLNNQILEYDSMQLNVQRRMSQGLQVGMAYTLARGNGWNGYNVVLLEADPSGELNKLFNWGPTSNNRKHNLNLNYTYMIPTGMPDTTFGRWVLADWQVSGVTKFLSGAATQPNCSTTTTGIANQNPTLTPGVTARCVYTGEPVFEVTNDPNLPEEDQLHFNPAAFAMATPFSATVGNFGDVPNGILRQPSFWTWDLTVARRFPIPQLGRNTQARLQLQLFNVFNTPQFTTMNTNLQFADDPTVDGTDSLRLNSTTQGTYTASNPPRQFGVTIRVDF